MRDSRCGAGAGAGAGEPRGPAGPPVLAVATALLLAGAAGMLAGGCDKFFPHRLPGEQLYVDNCADCHGVDGRGNTAREMGQQYADLTDDVWKFGGEDSAIANAIREGSFGLMPAFQEKLNDEQIRAVVSYVKVLRQRAGAGTQ
ncbi:MAG TPA: c-type cytochrome [Thermoanaerobaculia bacterium]|nr:c-type cytochrome [Thermoanaerobaculia bacterium]